jgi:hypothetical protein
MSTFWRHVVLAVGAALLAVAFAGATAGNAASASATTFSGQATVVKGKVLGLPLTLVDSGPVAVSGGEAEASLLCYPNGTNCAVGGLPDVTGGALNARVLHAAVVARGNTSRAEATVAEVNLVNVAGNTIGAELVSARAEATCTGGTASVKGSVEIIELTINGTTYAVGADVNRRIDLLGGGFVILNEQTPVASGGDGRIDVNAIRVVIPGPVPGTDTDLIVAAAHADIQCAALVECPGKHSFVTGGGFVSGKQHFTVAGRDGEAWGHVMWKPTGLHVKRPFAKVVRSLSALDAELSTRPEFTFTTSVLPNPGAFEGAAVLWWTNDGTPTGQVAGEALAVDMGEPGRSDFFELVSSGPGGLASAGAGFLGGGNVQMHGECKASGA